MGRKNSMERITFSECIKKELINLKKNQECYRVTAKKSGISLSRLWRVFNGKSEITLNEIHKLEESKLINPISIYRLQ
jgi:hypothetical protein